MTLDTGRLFNETYEVWAASERRYGRRIQAIAPRNDDLEALVKRQGINGFYQSRDARLACCHVRKVEPLNRALAGAHAWLTGLRGDQSSYRKDVALVEPDTDRGLIKVNPLIDWSREQALAFATANDVPLNALHAKGLRVDRVRALHPRHRARRTGARGPLVVGAGRPEGVRSSHAARRVTPCVAVVPSYRSAIPRSGRWEASDRPAATTYSRRPRGRGTVRD